MSSLYLNENAIVDCLYEDLPSDDQSCTTVDDTDDDQDYLPPQKAIIVEEDNETSDDTGNADEYLVDILNLNDNEIVKLPSPYKVRKNLRSFNKNVSRSLFSSKPTSSSTISIPEVNLPSFSSSIINNDNDLQIQVSIHTQNTSTDEFHFIPPTWSKNEDFSMVPLFDFIGTEGPSDLIDKEQDHTPFSVFKLLFSDEVINLLVEQTNLYAQQRYMKTAKLYTKTTNQEIMTFLGINILMGIKRLPSYRDYWSSAPDLHDDYISKLMTVNRFGWLLSTIHLNDNNMMPKKGEIGYDKLYKIRPYLTILKYNFQKYYNPNKIIAVDESMIKFKGRSTLKQYMPKKPIKRGYKVWSLADKKGYLWNFEIYAGKVGDNVETNLGGRVKDLSFPLQNKNHNLYIDNYFTSLPLLSYLKTKGINACGTINLTRKYLPKLSPDKNMKIGDYEWQITDEDNISIVKWKDKRIVSLLSNFHDPQNVTQVQRRSKDGSSTMINCPKVLQDYNNNMNCVDKFDQNKKSYQIDRKSHKWWHRIFFYFIDASIVNAHVTYKELCPEKMPIKQFRRDISRELVSKTLVQKRRLTAESSPSPVSIKKGKPTVSPTIRMEQSAHQPVRSTRRRCTLCSTKDNEIRTNWKCSICDVPLCLAKNKTCFVQYHSS